MRGTGPDLVFARGWITHLERVDEDPAVRAFFARLEQHFRVVRYDGRGNGLSQRELPKPVLLHHLVEDLRAVVEATCESTFTLWGSSWAGPTAISYAALFPENVTSLILDGTFAAGQNLTSPERAASFLAMLATARFQPEAVYSSMSFMTDPDPVVTHVARVERMRASIGPEALLALHVLLYEMDASELLDRVDAPTLVLHRKGSKSVPTGCARNIASGIPGAYLVEFEGQAHNMWEGNPEEVWAEVSDFLGCPGLADRINEAELSRSVSMLFIDQVGSTSQMNALGDRRGVEVQAQMIDMLYHAAKPFRAEHFSDTGDGLAFVVPSAADAVALAQVMLRRATIHNAYAAEDEHYHLRIGIHTGTIRTSQTGRTSGLAIAIAARLCDLGDTDQILVSEETLLLAREAIGDDIFSPKDQATLKGVGEVSPYAASW